MHKTATIHRNLQYLEKNHFSYFDISVIISLHGTTLSNGFLACAESSFENMPLIAVNILLAQQVIKRDENVVLAFPRKLLNTLFLLYYL